MAESISEIHFEVRPQLSREAKCLSSQELPNVTRGNSKENRSR